MTLQRVGDWLWDRGHCTLARWVWWEDHPLRGAWYEWRWPQGNGPRTVRHPLVCPVCDGEGGWVDAVPGCYGQGPYWPCGACDQRGVVSLWWMACYVWWDRVCPEWVLDALWRWHEWRQELCPYCGGPLADCDCATQDAEHAP